MYFCFTCVCSLPVLSTVTHTHPFPCFSSPSESPCFPDKSKRQHSPPWVASSPALQALTYCTEAAWLLGSFSLGSGHASSVRLDLQPWGLLFPTPSSMGCCNPARGRPPLKFWSLCSKWSFYNSVVFCYQVIVLLKFLCEWL